MGGGGTWGDQCMGDMGKSVRGGGGSTKVIERKESMGWEQIKYVHFS